MKKGYNLLVLDALAFFMENPYSETYLREFSRNLGISPNSAQRFLNLFVNEGLIREERKANLRYFRANLDSLLFRHMKKTYSIKKLIDSGLIEALKDKKFSNVVLFGSIAKGEDDKKSDMDLVCIGPKVDLRSLHEKGDRELNIKIFSLAEWKKQKEENKAFYQEVISTGIALIGGMPLV